MILLSLYIKIYGMKKYRFRYGKIVYLLLALVVAAAFAGGIWNVYNFVVYLSDVFKAVTYMVIALLTLFLAILGLSIMVYGRYVISGEYLYTCFGFIKTKTKISEVTEIVHFKKSDKLVAYNKKGEYLVIVISPAEYEDFILNMREINREIVYESKIDGEDTPEQ